MHPDRTGHARRGRGGAGYVQEGRGASKRVGTCVWPTGCLTGARGTCLWFVLKGGQRRAIWCDGGMSAQVGARREGSWGAIRHGGMARTWLGRQGAREQGQWPGGRGKRVRRPCDGLVTRGGVGAQGSEGAGRCARREGCLGCETWVCTWARCARGRICVCRNLGWSAVLQEALDSSWACARDSGTLVMAVEWGGSHPGRVAARREGAGSAGMVCCEGCGVHGVCGVRVIYEAMVSEGRVLCIRDVVCIWGGSLACLGPSVIFCP